MLDRNGGLTSAKLVTLILQLTETSRFKRKMHGRPALEEALLSGILNILGGAHIEDFEPIDLDDPDAAWYDIQRATSNEPVGTSATDDEIDAMMRGDLTWADFGDPPEEVIP